MKIQCLFLVFWLAISAAISQSTDFAVEVGAFAERVPLSYFKVGGVYETVDVNLIYRYYLDAPNRSEAEILRQKAIKAGHVNARIIDFNYIKQQCDAQCGYTPGQRTSNQASIGNSEMDKYMYWSKELKKQGMKIDSADLYAFWKKENKRIGMSQAEWFKLFKADLDAIAANKASGNPNGVRISDIDMYIYWSNELKKQGFKIDSADLFAFWKKEGSRIGMSRAEWFELFRKDLEALRESTYGNPNKKPIQIGYADMYSFWGTELRKKGVPMDSSSLYAFWKTNKDQIKMDSASWMQLFKNDILIPTNLTDARRIRSIFFDFGSAALRDASEIELNKLVSILNDHADWSVEIGAHTDSKGSVEANRKLSMRRANAARKYLIYKGIPSSRLTMQYYGKSRPVARNEMPDGADSEEGRQLNRRVEFAVLNAQGSRMDVVFKIEVPLHLRY